MKTNGRKALKNRKLNVSAPSGVDCVKTLTMVEMVSKKDVTILRKK
jgi:hypothetical protein